MISSRIVSDNSESNAEFLELLFVWLLAALRVDFQF